MLTRVTRVFIFTSFLFFSASAFGAIVTLQFAGRVTHDQLGFTVGSWMTVCFSYDSTADRIQSATHPLFAFSIPQHNFHFERNLYSVGVFDNWNMAPETFYYDGLFLEFSYPSGYGSLSLLSRDTTLFTGAALPQTIPPLENFSSKAIHITVD